MYKLRIMEYVKDKLLNVQNLPRICFYCGEPAGDVEHVTPRSLVGENTSKVFSCSECNSIASDKFFFDVNEKFEFIQEQLRKRYKKILSMPSWSQNELNELGPMLRQDVKKAIAKKAWVTRRLLWKNQPHVLIAAKVLEQNAIGNDFVLTSAEQDIMRKKSARLCYSID